MTFVIYKFTIHLKLTCKGTNTNKTNILSRVSTPEPLSAMKTVCFLLGVVWRSVVNTHLGSGKKTIPDSGQQGGYFYKLHISCNMKLCSSQQKGNTSRKIKSKCDRKSTKQLLCLVFPFL